MINCCPFCNIPWKDHTTACGYVARGDAIVWEPAQWVVCGNCYGLGWLTRFHSDGKQWLASSVECPVCMSAGKIMIRN
jgi:hypothetical protein